MEATENIATAIENIVTCLHAICLMSQDEAKCDSYGRQINKKNMKIRLLKTDKGFLVQIYG